MKVNNPNKVWKEKRLNQQWKGIKWEFVRIEEGVMDWNVWIETFPVIRNIEVNITLQGL